MRGNISKKEKKIKAVKYNIYESELVKTKLVANNNSFFTWSKEELVKSVQYICKILSYKQQLHTPVIQTNIFAFVCEKLTLFTQM